MRRLLQSILASAALAFLAIGAAGCKSNEPDNVSSRPWNSTEGWQGGFPTGLNEGR